MRGYLGKGPGEAVCPSAGPPAPAHAGGTPWPLPGDSLSSAGRKLPPELCGPRDVSPAVLVEGLGLPVSPSPSSGQRPCSTRSRTPQRVQPSGQNEAGPRQVIRVFSPGPRSHAWETGSQALWPGDAVTRHPGAVRCPAPPLRADHLEVRCAERGAEQSPQRRIETGQDSAAHFRAPDSGGGYWAEG